MKIIIDPYRGGQDTGQNINNKYEKNLLLELSKYMSEEFNKQGIDTELVRTNDVQLSDDERNSIINEIKNIVETIPNELDEAEKKRIEMLDQMIQTFGNNLDNCKDSKAYDFISKKYNSLLREKEKVKDCGPRYEKIFDILA